MKRILSIVIAIIGLSACLHAQDKLAKKWIHKQYATLSLKEKIAQLMVIRTHSNWDQNKIDSISDLIRTYNIGGLCFFQGGPIREALQTNYYQSIAKTPLLITMDAESGVGMRLDSVESFPRQLSLGAMPSNNLVYQMGAAIAAQCKRLGIQVNYAPVVDINNNPLNPVINDRSFGQNKQTVLNYGIAYMKGLQDNGVMATAKHFPGHGDVSVDSHFELPIIQKLASAIDSMELVPFKALIEAGVASVMVAHLSVPAIDEKMPTSLSANAVNNLLKKKLGFEGISITDALDMKAISSNYPPGEASVQAIIAGNDMLCLPEDIEQSIKSIELAIKQKRLKKRDINARVKKILNAKYTYGLGNLQKIDTTNIVADLNATVAVMKAAISKQALTYLRPNTYAALNTNKKIAYVALGTMESNVLTEAFLKHKNTSVFYIDGKDSIAFSQLKSNLNKYDQIVIGLHNYNRRPANNFEIPTTILGFLNEPGHEKWIHLIMGNPYAIANFPNINNILVAYEDNKYSQQAVLDWLEGKATATGILPVSINESLQMGLGFQKSEKDNALQPL